MHPKLAFQIIFLCIRSSPSKETQPYDECLSKNTSFNYWDIKKGTKASEEYYPLRKIAPETASKRTNKLLAQLLTNYGLFLAKLVTLVIAFTLVISLIGELVRRSRTQPHEQLLVRKLNERYEHMLEAMEDAIYDKNELKKLSRLRKRKKKQEHKALKRMTHPDEQGRKRVYVLDFEGDIQASAVENLREEITAVLKVARKQDEVLLRLESSGGLVHSYGLAASQLTRIRDAELMLTVAVDKVAASGGYMMACVGQRILTAPFAIIGSIGVVAQLPNFHKWLERHDVDFELHTAGEYKRTLTMFGENTEKGRQKFQEELEQTHGLFKQFIVQNRPKLDIDHVATGEYWYGIQAVALNLADELRTSDEYLMGLSEHADLYQVDFKRRMRARDRLGAGMSAWLKQVLLFASSK